MSIEIKQKIKEVADDLKMPTKEVIEIVGKFYDKPKSSSQNLTEDQLNVIFDHITRNHQIDSLEQVFAVKPAAPAPAAPQAPAAQPQASAAKPAAPQQQRPAQNQSQNGPRPQNQNAPRPQDQNAPRTQDQNASQRQNTPAKPKEPERKRERRVIDTISKRLRRCIVGDLAV